MFSNFRPFFEVIRLTSKFVLPQLDGPAMMQRIEFGSRALCFRVSDFTDGSHSFLLSTGMSIDCLLNCILNSTNTNLDKFQFLNSYETLVCLSVTVKMLSERESQPAKGGSFIDSIINKMPFEMHVPTYNFCGPG